MKIRIKGVADGRELLVKTTTRTLIELQQQTGWDMSKISQGQLSVLSGVLSAFAAMHNAGFEPKFDELLDRDVEDFQIVPEPGDTAVGAPVEADASDPQSALAGSSPGEADSLVIEDATD